MQASAIEQAIGSALDQIGVQHDHVCVTSYNPAAGNITIDMGLSKQVGTGQKIDFSLGLPSLPFKVTSTGDINVTVGMEYDSLRFGINNQLVSPFFVDTSPLNELKVSFNAGLSPTAKITADAGLFQVSAKPLDPTKFGLHAGISFDVGGVVAPSLTGYADADLVLTGAIGGTDALGNFEFPNIQANFLMNWDLGTKAAANPDADPAHFGDSAPTVSFQDVKVGFGEYLSTLLSPLTAALQTFLTVYDPYLELINFDIPGLDDIFTKVGLPHANILNIAKALVDTGVISDPIAQAVVRYSDFLTSLKDEVGDLFSRNVNPIPNAMMDLGNFDLSPNGDLRTLPMAKELKDTVAADGTISQDDALSLLKPFAGVVSNLQGQLDDLAAEYPSAQGFITVLKQAVNKLQTDFSLTFPFTDDPVNGAFALLLGRDATLVQFNVNLPSLSVQLAKLMDKYGPPVLDSTYGPASARLDGTLDADITFSGGYDTHGLREFLLGPNQGDIAMLADGFFFDSSKPILSADGSFIIEAGPRINATFSTPLGDYGVQAGIEGRGEFDFQNLSLSFDDPNLDGDNRFRPFVSDADRNLFTASGSLSGSLSIDVYAELDGGIILGSHRDTLASYTIASGTLLDFGGPDYQKTNPFRPADAPPKTYVGWYDFAAERPDLANDGIPDVLYASVQNGVVQIYELKTAASPFGVVLVPYVLKTYAINDPKGTLTEVIVKGSHDGTTFHLPADGGAITYEAVGQGKPGTKDILAVLPVSSSSYTQASIGGTGLYGLSEVQILNMNGSVIATSGAILYSNLSGVSVDMSATNRSVINISAATSIPVDLNLSSGDDQVTIETRATTTDLSQEYTIHGNGGIDTVTFRKTTPTYLDARFDRPTDVYTIDNHHLNYQSTQDWSSIGFIDPNNILIDARTPCRSTSPSTGSRTSKSTRTSARARTSRSAPSIRMSWSLCTARCCRSPRTSSR